MFVNAIETVAQFTRPVHSIQRFFGSTEVFAGTATLFFVNDEGWALTCRHVAEQFIAGDKLQQGTEKGTGYFFSGSQSHFLRI